MKNNWSQEKYLKAYRFAAEKHKDQLFPGTNWSYVAHLSMVSMEIIAALNYEPDINGDVAVQAAILHDTIEDTYTTHDELLSKFGRKVADGVLSLTKDKSVKKQDQMLDSLRRIKNQPKEIWMVKLADRITNLQPPPAYWDNEKRVKYLEQAQVIYNELKDGSEYLSERLCGKLLDYRKYIDQVQKNAYNSAMKPTRTYQHLPQVRYNNTFSTEEKEEMALEHASVKKEADEAQAKLNELYKLDK